MRRKKSPPDMNPDNSDVNIDLLDRLLGGPPTIEGEDPDAYNTLLAKIETTVSPKDIFEMIWVRDFVEHTWEIFRLRRLKPAVFMSGRELAVGELLAGGCLEAASACGMDWAASDRETRDEKLNELKEKGYSTDDINGRALTNKIDVFDRIEKMIIQAETRRIKLLEDIEWRRDVLAKRLRQASGDIEEAEFKMLPGDKAKN